MTILFILNPTLLIFVGLEFAHGYTLHQVRCGNTSMSYDMSRVLLVPFGTYSYWKAAAPGNWGRGAAIE